MYVCICKGITDTEIRQAVDGGATSYRQVRQSLGVATQCGQCACEAKQIVKAAIKENNTLLSTPLFYAAG